MSKRLLMLGFGHPRQTTNILFKALSDKLAERYHVEFVLRRFPLGVLAKIRYQIRTAVNDVTMVARSDHIVIYASAALSIIAIITARLLKRQTTLFVWDVYPDAKAEASGKSIRSPAIRLYGLVESVAMTLVDTVVVPSTDYARHPALAGKNNVIVYPLWPTAPLQLPARPVPKANDALSLVFPGQLLGSRDIDTALARISSAARRPVALDVYEPGRTAVEEKSIDNVGRIRFLPPVEPDDLPAVLAGYDFGLVSLSATYALPAAPSKTLAYLAAGLPVIYHGPPNAFIAEHVHGKIGVDIGACDEKNDLIAMLKEIRSKRSERFTETYSTLALDWDRLASLF